MHERDCDSVERFYDARDLSALNCELRLGRLEASCARGRDCTCDIGTHKRESPASGFTARGADDFEHRLLEFEKCLPRAVANFADSFARDADCFVRGDRVFENRSHHDDML